MASTVCLVACVLVAFALPLPGDREWLVHVYDRDPISAPIAEPFQWLASPVVYLPTLAVLWLATRSAAAMVAALVPLASTTLKVVLGPRGFSEVAFGNGAASYPSGHTAYAVALGGYLAVRARRAGRRGLLALFAGLAALMGPMRVLGGAHLPSDVVGGWLLGLAWLFAVLAIEPARASEARGPTAS